MKYAVVFKSETGNTKVIAETIYNALSHDDCVYMGNPAEANVGEAELVFAGFWTDRGSCDDDMTEFLEKLENKKVAFFGTAGFGGSSDYFAAILGRVAAHLTDTNFIIDGYMCQGKMPIGVKDRYKSKISENPEDPQLKRMLNNFDRAESHPDTFDLRAAKAFACAALKKAEERRN